MGTKEDFEVIEQDWEECKYCERSYYEYDTGYAEYECSIYGTDQCFSGDIHYGCPLSFKYKVEEE